MKALDLKNFIGQIDYLSKYYHYITMEDFIESIEGRKSLPKNSLLLTFDDGYSDHYLNAFPVLFNKGIQGSFFIPSAPVQEKKILDVNKIHLLLAKSLADSSFQKLYKDIWKLIEKYQKTYELKSLEYYRNIKFPGNGLDTEEVIFIKRMLQSELPYSCRKVILDELFEEYLGVSERVINNELYVNQDQISTMLKSGMHIGSHGHEHFWLHTLTYEEQEQDLRKSLSFLIESGVNPDTLTICYPYGSYNETTIEILKKMNFKLGFIDPSVTGIAELTEKNRFEFPRIDTIDFPYSGDSDSSKWTLELLKN
ncbi:polysaccharide deacetylase family protein [Leptospira ryugenii]|nr:polysaccharide deacetylase family protein [Leptospira ryugenii]